MTGISLVLAAISVLGFLGMLAAGFVVIRSSALKTSAAAWREEAEAQKARADRLEDALQDLDKRVGTLEVENRRLAELATGRQAVADLAALVTTYHADVMTALQRGDHR